MLLAAIIGGAIGLLLLSWVWWPAG